MTTDVSGPARRRRICIITLSVAAFLVGFLVRGRTTGPPPAPASGAAPVAAVAHTHEAMPTTAEASEALPDFWTCAMHPQIQLPAPGKCPICGMDLIPTYSEATAQDAPRRLVMSPAARQLADIQTTPVTRRMVETQVRMVGKIAYDETRLGHITARFPGRIDALHVDYTGVTVRKGDHMADLYSPQLISAQEELFQAIQAQERLQHSELAVMRETAASTVDAARSKLRLWDLTPAQIAEIERRRTVAEHVTIYAPMAGIVIDRNATEGMYVETGTRIYTIARLDLVWVLLEAYESDLAWLRYGQDVEFMTEAYPGETFHGRIAFIDPILDPKTRTVRVRANVENTDGRLKPDLFVRAVVRSALAAGGAVVEPSLAGKWIGPMHPEIVRDEPGPCPICGMDLVQPHELGLMPAMPPDEAPLVIPATAPLVTGKRAVVYVEVPGAAKPTFDGREITLGPRTGDHYIVLEGLQEGERVVTQGNFKIDSALQIMAKPSMMSPEGGVAQIGHAGHGASGQASARPAGGQHAEHAQPAASQPTGHVVTPTAARPSRALQVALGPVFTSYFGLQDALANDDFERARAAFGRLHGAARQIPLTLAAEPDRDLWRPRVSRIEQAAGAGMVAADLTGARAAFLDLSEAMIETEQRVGHASPGTYFEVFCPMANDGRGASWLQTAEPIRNPFYGQGMLSCGEMRHTYAAQPGAVASQPAAGPATAPATAPAAQPHVH